MSEEQNRAPESPRTRRARSPRVPVEFSIELEGQTPAGEPFRVEAKAVKVSRGGGTLKTEAELAVGAVIRLTPPFGRAIQAEVNGIWRDEADGGQRIGIKLLEPNGWFAG
ncbi:MAG: PilZ domain-containing protein [Acidobacteria bacterium]|nr:PilZ domain-containing protein [Acidobacteriota bacterium]